MFRLNRVLGGALFAFVLLAGPIARADEDPVNLVIKPKAGRVIHIQSTIKTNAAGVDLVVDQTVKNTIKSVKTNGDIVEETVYESSTVSAGGMQQEQKLPPPFSTTRDKFGKIKEGRKITEEGFMSVEVSKLMEILNAFILTDKPVKANDTWVTESENPVVTDRKFTIKDTYLGVEKIDGKDYRKIKQTADATVDVNGTLLNYEATEWVNPADGEILKIETTIKNVPTQAGSLTLAIATKAVKGDGTGKPGKKDN